MLSVIRDGDVLLTFGSSPLIRKVVVFIIIVIFVVVVVVDVVVVIGVEVSGDFEKIFTCCY